MIRFISKMNSSLLIFQYLLLFILDIRPIQTQTTITTAEITSITRRRTTRATFGSSSSSSSSFAVVVAAQVDWWSSSSSSSSLHQQQVFIEVPSIPVEEEVENEQNYYNSYPLTRATSGTTRNTLWKKTNNATTSTTARTTTNTTGTSCSTEGCANTDSNSSTPLRRTISPQPQQHQQRHPDSYYFHHHQQLLLDDYDWTQSTETNYRVSSSSSNEAEEEYGYDNDDDNDSSSANHHHHPPHKFFLYGNYQETRKRLDYSYHGIYTKSRQLFQDTILHSILMGADDTTTTTSTIAGKGKATSTTTTTTTSTTKDQKLMIDKDVSKGPWIIFTAGVMGAGKTYTVRRLQQQGVLPFVVDDSSPTSSLSVVKVDPDELRWKLPEYVHYIQQNPNIAGQQTQKEAGMLAELLTNIALDEGRNVVVDGSLSDVQWYTNYFIQLRQLYPTLQIGIIHVTAPFHVIQERVRERAKTTGRVIPSKVLQDSFEKVPKSVQILQHQVDFFLEIANNGNHHHHHDMDIVNRDGSESESGLSSRPPVLQPRKEEQLLSSSSSSYYSSGKKFDLNIIQNNNNNNNTSVTQRDPVAVGIA